MSLFHHVVQAVGLWLPPKFCVLCDKRAEDFLCVDCLAQFHLAPTHCVSCSRPVVQQGAICGHCLTQPPAIDGLQVVFQFDGLVRKLVLAAKFGANRAALEVMCRALSQLSFPAVDCVIPLPIALRRLQMRGFNQSSFLARAVAKKLQVPVCNDVLVKKWRVPQSQLQDADARRKNIRGAFTLNQSISGTILLIDDVYTTGATLNEASVILKRGGAQQVFAAVFAAGFKEV